MRTPNSERVHIAIFGNCNSGKSSLINAITGEQTAIVSDVAGTTTDLVKRAVELPNIGAALLIDTPGLDDNTALGTLRSEQSRKALMQTDIAIVLLPVEDKFMAQIRALEIPVIQVTPKADIATDVYKDSIAVSATTGKGIDSLITAIAGSCEQSSRLITEGVCSSGDTVVLVMPQDSSAPKGRLIKPQVEVIRELLDRGCSAICCQPDRLVRTKKLISPHTLLNKITGLLLFLLPATISFIDLTYTLPIVCTVATVAAMHEWFYMEKKHDT